MKQAPVRLCCFQRHWGTVCPDGLVMCQLCFKRVSIDNLSVVDGIKENVCKECAESEQIVNLGGNNHPTDKLQSTDPTDPYSLRYNNPNPDTRF